eukprot:scaffold2246_cov162-Amphora_coffeaeformis.AAC.3
MTTTTTTSSSTSSTPSSTTDNRKVGILVVGIGGNNGVTLLAGHLANQRGLTWESTAVGRTSAPNWKGCITQIPPRGVSGGCGFQGRFDLANASHAAIGGWDIRSKALGDALYECRVLDYDLVRQVRDDLNQWPILKGMYDASFVGETQHATATHIVTHCTTWMDKVNHIRQDIRAFIQEHQVNGHTTVIWSASVERIADVDFATAAELLEAITTNKDIDLSPSILYATAAALEGCSFINGGSQNTISPGLCQLFEQTTRQSLVASNNNNSGGGGGVVLLDHVVCDAPAYMLGTDWKAGQTKFKTAAVEYIRALGMQPRVIASSNHLGNNDMLNLTSKKTVAAKMRVKSDIFGPWHEEALDHQVRVMYTQMMGDEKRDVVEYTSLGFLDCPHTMLTYTRCMDSILCVPLMVDGAIWCDFFARHKTDSTAVAQATAYMFKVPEGGAKGVDPGFQKQMQVLEQTLQTVAVTASQKSSSSSSSSDHGELQIMLEKGVTAGILTAEQAASLLALQ